MLLSNVILAYVAVGIEARCFPVDGSHRTVGSSVLIVFIFVNVTGIVISSIAAICCATMVRRKATPAAAAAAAACATTILRLLQLAQVLLQVS